jgi:hypothetical protein
MFLAQFSHVFIGKATVLAKFILHANVGCYKMSDTHFLLKSGSEKTIAFFEFEISLHKDYCVEMLSECSNERDNLIFRYST